MPLKQESSKEDNLSIKGENPVTTTIPAGIPQAKHAPKTPKGTKFKWADNGTIKTNPFKVNQPATLSLKLTDTAGTTHTFDYPTQNPDWSSKEAVFKANTWYNQLIARKLNRPNPEESRATRYRPQWSKQEKEYLEIIIKDKIRETKRKPTAGDWEDIAQAQNDRFLGQSVHPGQALALNNDQSRIKTGKPSQRRPIAKKRLDIPNRTAHALIGAIRKWPDTTKLVNDLLEEVGYYGSEQSGDEGQGKRGDVSTA